MSTTFEQVQIVDVPLEEKVIYTSIKEENTTTLVFSGTVSNKQTDNGFDYVSTFTLKKRVGDIVTVIFDSITVLFGTTLVVPKLVLPPGAELIVSAEGNIDLTLEIVKFTKVTV